MTNTADHDLPPSRWVVAVGTLTTGDSEPRTSYMVTLPDAAAPESHPLLDSRTTAVTLAAMLNALGWDEDDYLDHAKEAVEAASSGNAKRFLQEHSPNRALPTELQEPAGEEGLFDVHAYEPGNPEPVSLPNDMYVVDPTQPLNAERALIEAALRARGLLQDGGAPEGSRWVPVFRVPDTDTWLELTPHIHPDGLDLAAFDRASQYVRELAAGEHQS